MELVADELIKKYNLPYNMTVRDYNEWQALNATIKPKEELGWPCESWKDQRFSIIARYYYKNKNK